VRRPSNRHRRGTSAASGDSPRDACEELLAATPDDLAPIRELLAELSLPAADVGAENQRFVVARARGELVGCAALELYGSGALLRSLAVRGAMQGRGLGRALYERVMANAAGAGVTDVFLLTTTAERFFARQGFRRIARDDVPERVRASAEFASLCPATAVCMARRVERRRGASDLPRGRPGGPTCRDT
jgi:N-acetylglutamate synthase-like GNAT family acetyltransferase